MTASKGGATTQRARKSDDDDVNLVTAAMLNASRLLVAISARSIASVREHITVAQFRMLVVLSQHEELKLVTLAERLAVNPSTAMRMVDRLIASDLVSKQINPSNRRETLLRLTGTGSRVVDQVTQRRREEIAAIVVRMSPSQRRGVVAALQAFTEAGGEPPTEASATDTFPLGWE